MQTTQVTTLTLVFSLCGFVACSAEPPGEVIGWGRNCIGQAEDLMPDAPWTGPIKLGDAVLTNAVAIAAGMEFCLVLQSDGTVAGSGFDNHGRATGASPGDAQATNGLVRIDGRILDNVVAIAAGRDFGLGLKKDGTVVGWGSSEQGEARIPPGLSNVVAIAAGWSHGLAVKRDGTVTAWGQPKNSFVGISNIVAVAATKSWFGHDLALKDDGTVLEWNASFGEATAVEGLSNVVAIAAGKSHNLALRKDGTVAQWGLDSPVPVAVAGLNNVVAISAGEQYSLALKKDGSVAAWGNQRFYREIPAGLTNVTAIAAGDGFCLAIKRP